MEEHEKPQWRLGEDTVDKRAPTAVATTWNARF